MNPQPPAPGATLSSRERALLAMLLQNRNDYEMAAALGVNEVSLRRAIDRLAYRLGVANRNDLKKLAFESTLESLERRLPVRGTIPRDPPEPSECAESAQDFDGFWMFMESNGTR